MLKLITAVEVRTRMGIDPQLASGVDPVIESFITSAQLRLEAVLDSGFEQASHVDTFNLDSTVVGGVIPDGYFRLYLNSGFVRPNPVPTIGYGYSSLLMPLSDFFLNAEKGLLYVAASYEGSKVSISYDSGFDENDVPAPEWLQEALISAVAPLMNSTQPTNKSEAAAKFYATINQHIADILSRHNRNPGLVLKAIQ